MKKLFFAGLLMAGMGLGLSSIPINAEAYQCQWRNGHKVCWHHGVRQCRWVPGHWYYGYYYKGHRVCWYVR